MFLKYLQIVNYKNLRSARFSFVEGVNTVIGENDSGKSNAMTALRILLDDTYYYNTKRLGRRLYSGSRCSAVLREINRAELLAVLGIKPDVHAPAGACTAQLQPYLHGF